MSFRNLLSTGALAASVWYLAKIGFIGAAVSTLLLGGLAVIAVVSIINALTPSYYGYHAGYYPQPAAYYPSYYSGFGWRPALFNSINWWNSRPPAAYAPAAVPLPAHGHGHTHHTGSSFTPATSAPRVSGTTHTGSSFTPAASGSRMASGTTHTSSTFTRAATAPNVPTAPGTTRTSSTFTRVPSAPPATPRAQPTTSAYFPSSSGTTHTSSRFTPAAAPHRPAAPPGGSTTFGGRTFTSFRR